MMSENERLAVLENEQKHLDERIDRHERKHEKEDSTNTIKGDRIFTRVMVIISTLIAIISLLFSVFKK